MTSALSTRKAEDLEIREAVWYERACPLCRGARPVAVIDTRVYFIPTRRERFKFEFHDCVCTGCGFVMARDVPDENFLNDYYAAGFLRVRPGGEVPFGFDAGFRLATLHTYLPKGARILEAGAGDGAFVDAMNGAGFIAAGIDLVDDEGETTVVQQAFRGRADNGHTVDAVVTYYMLEHVTDPRHFLEACKSWLPVGGLLVIEVPNLENHPDEALHHEHFSYFTANSLRALVEAVGFKVLTQQPSTASRYFGQTLIARLDDPSRNAEVQPLADDDVTATVERARHLVTKAAHAIEEREAAAARLIAKIIRERGLPGSFELIVWGANQMATDIGLAALVAGIEERAILDRAPTRTGHAHDGYDVPIRQPEFAKAAARHRVIIVCSQVWHDHIRAEIDAMQLQDVSIYSAFPIVAHSGSRG